MILRVQLRSLADGSTHHCIVVLSSLVMYVFATPRRYIALGRIIALMYYCRYIRAMHSCLSRRDRYRSIPYCARSAYAPVSSPSSSQYTLHLFAYYFISRFLRVFRSGFGFSLPIRPTRSNHHHHLHLRSKSSIPPAHSPFTLFILVL